MARVGACGHGRRVLGRPLALSSSIGIAILSVLLGVPGFACNSAELKGPGDGTSSSSSGDPADPGPGDPDGGPADGGRDPGKDLDGGVLPTSSNVTIQVLPSDSGAAVLAAIKGATTSIHMTIYLLSNSQIIDALGALKAAGKEVKVILNKNFPPNGGDNTSAYNQLTAKGVSVVYAPPGYQFTHAKTVLIDGKSLLVMTMNLTYASPRDNREYIATDNDPADVADAEKLFQADFTDKQVSVTGKLIVSPQSASPVDARARLKALIDSAKTSLDVEVQSLSDDALTDAIIAAHKDKVAVRVVLAGGNNDTPAEADSIAKLKAASVPLKMLADPYVHAKAVVVDGTKVFVGSQNFTPTALFNNREVGVVTDSATEAKKVTDTIAKDFTAGTAP